MNFMVNSWFTIFCCSFRFSVL